MTPPLSYVAHARGSCLDPLQVKALISAAAGSGRATPAHSAPRNHPEAFAVTSWQVSPSFALLRASSASQRFSRILSSKHPVHTSLFHKLCPREPNLHYSMYGVCLPDQGT